jgi:hypothetical protein
VSTDARIRREEMKRTRTVLFGLTLTVAVMVLMAGPALAATFTGSTTLGFSANPATLSGDSDPDVTITTTTTAPGGNGCIDQGKVMIELATDGTLLDGDSNPIGGNPVPSSEVVYWLALNDPGQYPSGGITNLSVDLDGLGFVSGTTGGFRAHYVTGGGKDKVGTHFSDPVDLTAIACEWVGETAWAAGTRYIEKGNWATFTRYEADDIVVLYAGQTMEAGTVYFSAPDVNGNVTITITLNDGWRFKDVAENVKIQDYELEPSGNPNPGGFAHTFDAEASPFDATEIPENYFYGVHVDVEWLDCSSS